MPQLAFPCYQPACLHGVLEADKELVSFKKAVGFGGAGSRAREKARERELIRNDTP